MDYIMCITNYSIPELFVLLSAVFGLLVMLLLIRIKIGNLFLNPSERKNIEIITEGEINLIRKYRSSSADKQNEIIEILSNGKDS